MGKKRDQTRRAAELTAREKMLDERTMQLDVREAAAERGRLLVQLRDVNERLVLASLQAQESADDANAARAAADVIAERFRSLVQTTSALIWHATPDGRVEPDPEAWLKLTGVSIASDKWSWLEAVHPMDRDRVRDAWNTAVAVTAPYAVQHRLRSREGGYRWVVARAVPIMTSKIVREWIGMMSDVSDRVRVEEARDQFIIILGHDLRNPLASIVGGVDLLRDLPEPYARTIARLGRSARRINAIIRDLLDFARGRLGGGIPITPRPCDMRLLCHGVIEEIRQAHPTRMITFEGTGDLSGEWDPDRIEQVISNLVGNAIVHGTDPVTVTSHVEGDRVVTSVHNHGTPIPEALLSTLFEPFTRGQTLDEDEPTTSEGLGLGLYIANEIISVHGGALTVTSRAMEGTTFRFGMLRSVPRRYRTRP